MLLIQKKEMFVVLVVISLVFQCVSASNGVDVSPKYLNPIKTGTDLIEKHRTEDSILAQSKVDSLKHAVSQGTNQATLQFTSNPPPSLWNYSSTSSGRAILTATVTASLSGSAGTPTGVFSLLCGLMVQIQKHLQLVSI